jgi:serine/threonine-protein kinase
MTTDRWTRIEALFAEGARRRLEDRAAWLDLECGGDVGLRDEVDALLRADECAQSGEFITRAIAGAAEDLTSRAEARRLGERVGPYRLVGELGHGGMGTVYLAERDDAEYRATVAVKVVRGALSGPEVLHRFRAERQILADLTHPNIARLLDGGAADDGTPYLVMEYVEGSPIDRYCDEHRLGLRDRVDLFRTACAAVQYAHQHLVIHRDLKPSNILVTSGGSPKLVDFGIAKLLAPDGTDGETTGRLGPMTPSYASPEQVSGGRITVAADVYSLGVVLYRLIAGRLPLDLRDASPVEVIRAVTETEPPAPSTVTRMSGRRQGTNDLDLITLKALRKAPADRYASVAELAEDLRRWAAGEPVLARRGTWSYRARRFAGRHALSVAVSLGVVVLVAGLTTVYTVRLARERDRARLETVKAEQVAQFLTGLFEVSDPGIEVQGRNLTAQQLLDRGAARIDAELVTQPEIQVHLMTTIGRVYLQLGLHDEAATQLEGALAVLRTLDHPEDGALADALSGLSVVRRGMGDYQAADSLGTQALEVLRRENRPPDLLLANTLRGLAETRRVNGDNAAADSLNRAALAIHRLLLPTEHRSIADDLNNIALVSLDRGAYAEAERMHRESLAMRRRLFSQDHPDVSNSLNNLGVTLTAVGEYEEATGLLREALRLRQRTLGPDEARTLNTMRNLGRVLWLRGQLAEADTVLRSGLDLMGLRLNPRHPYVLNALTDLSLVLNDQGLRDSAAAVAQRALDASRSSLGDAHPSTTGAAVALARIQAASGNRAVAERSMREVAALQRKTLGAGHPGLAATLYQLGTVLAAEGRFDEGEAAAREAARIHRGSLAPGHWQTALAETLLGEMLAGLGRSAEAESLLVSGHAIVSRDQPPPSPARADARRRLVAFLQASGQATHAARVP